MLEKQSGESKREKEERSGGRKSRRREGEEIRGKEEEKGRRNWMRKRM